jgi:hypothetical protein
MKTISLIRRLESRSPAEKLWALVLLLAIRDRATKVCYDGTRDDEALSYDINGNRRFMVPPPKFLTLDLIAAAEEMVAHPSGWRRLIGWWRSGSPAASANVEKVAEVAVGPERLALQVAVERMTSSVVFQLSPNSQAAFAAKYVLKTYIRRPLSPASGSATA